MAYENWRARILFADWVDVTADIDSVNSPINSTSGEGTETDYTSGSCTLVLNNPVARFTPGNVLSDLYPYVRSGRQVELTETIDGVVNEIFTGRLEWPEVDSWVKTSETEPRDTTITLTAVDLPAQLDSALPLSGNLAEHIRYHGGAALARYWPLNDASKPWLPVIGDEPFTTAAESLPWGESTAGSGTAQVAPASTDGPPGDDVQAPLYEMRIDTVAGFQRPTRYMVTSVAFEPGAMTVAAGQVMTIVFWVKRSSVYMDAESLLLLVRYFLSPTDGVIGLMVQDTDITWLCDVTGATTASFVGPVAPTEKWTAVAVRYGFGPNVIELWTDAVQTVGTLSFSPVGPARIDNIYLPEGRFAGAIKDVQVYIGAAEDWTFADFTAQRNLGLSGMAQQTSGERIRTVLAYAGVDPADMTQVDDGVALMQRATLAGQTPGDAISEAVTTEQGSFYADGAGKPVFDDRRTLYNI